MPDALPKTMRAVLCRRFGGLADLEIAELPVPEPGPGEVLIRVRAAGLNFFDTLILENEYQLTPDLPFSPAGEVCGEIAALGPGVAGRRIGERVAAYLGWGGARDYVVAKADALTAVPDAVDDRRAAGLSIAYGTTLHALIDRAALRHGETLAVLGASGGTGLAAVEIGAALGARVIACASSEDKLALARAAGATEGVDYAREDLKARLKALTGGAGVDVVYDPVGGALADAALCATAWEGRYLVIGFAGGEIPKIPLNLVLLKGCDLRGVYWGAFVAREPARHAAHMARLLAWVAEGRIAARVEAAYPLEETADAIGRIARREARGKIVIEP